MAVQLKGTASAPDEKAPSAELGRLATPVVSTAGAETG